MLTFVDIFDNSVSSRIPESVHYKGKYRSNTHDQCEIFNKFFTDQCSDASNYNIAYGPSREFDSFEFLLPLFLTF